MLLLARLQPLLPLALAVASMPHLWAERRAAGFKLQAMADQSRAAREMDYCARIVTEAGAAKEVRVFGLRDFFLRRFQARCETALAEISRVRLAQVRLSVACGGLYMLALGGGFWYVGAQVGAGRLALGDIALYLGAVMQAQARLSILAWVFGEFHESLLQMRRLFAFLDDARPAITLAPRGEGHMAPAALHSGIALHGVRFRYPGSAEEVLHNVNALLPAGKVTALVGANGAGKSTLVKLLTRMYDPTGGTILLDAMELAAYDLASLRARIAVVYQDLARFALSLGENIAVGAAALEPCEVDVEQAARWAGADEVAARLPRGYDTQLTHQFEGGVELSGGEWQKVALARAFVRDAALVILDEPTAALDAAAEYQLFERFRDVVAGKTALVISHRFSTVRMADQILVLDGGRIVEAGSHAELVALDGRYATLYEMQAARYRENPGAIHAIKEH